MTTLPRLGCVLLLCGPVSSLEYFEGTVMISGFPNTISCSCEEPQLPVVSGAPLPFIAPALCDVMHTSYVTEEKGLAALAASGLKDEDVSTYFGQPREVKLTPIVKSTGQRVEFACADSRWSSQKLYTLGGELGEVLLAVHVLDSLRERQLEVEEIAAALRNWLKVSNLESLTFCTDRAAMTLFDAQLGGAVDLDSPPETLQAAALAALAEESKMHGDLMWKCLTRSPNNYRLKKTVLKAVLQAFFSIHWASDRSVNTATRIHTGEAEPLAVIRLIEKSGCESSRGVAISATQPLLGGKRVSAVLYNPSAVALRRAELIAFLTTQFGDEAHEYATDIAAHVATEWAETCVTETFPNLPVYTLTFA